MKSTSSLQLLGLVMVGVAVFGAMSCGPPPYPSCESDEHCKAKKEFCISNKCQQCRGDKDCSEGSSCNAGRCDPIPNYCRDAAQCPSGQVCLANRCRPCGSDSECGGDLKCLDGGCMKPQCQKDDECAQDQECQRYRCVSARPKPPEPHCPLASVYFDIDKATLTPAATSTLGDNVSCIKKHNDAVNLVGRADPRGTPEYNMALSDRRAQAVKEYLQRVGIPSTRLIAVPKGELEAGGSDDASWAKDRRVDSEWQ